MKYLSFITLLLLFLLQVSCNLGFTKDNTVLSPSNTLWYTAPAKIWPEALPIGNGRLGAMVYGGLNEEIIQFNEETLWAVQPHDYAHEDAYEVLGELRQLLWDGKQAEAQKLGNERFMSQSFGQMCYQPFGNILLNFQGHENEIHPLTTPEFAEACKVTLSHRGDGGTGWSRAWKING